MRDWVALAGSGRAALREWWPGRRYRVSGCLHGKSLDGNHDRLCGGAEDRKVRIHLDVQVDDIATARNQVESLGGRWSGERHQYDEGVVMVMHDPEEHEFCLVQYYR